MSKAIEILPGHPLYNAQKLKRSVFKRQTPQAAIEFNAHMDPLLYREQLPKPESAIPGTGFGAIDTSVRMIHEKPGDENSPIRGIKLTSHGILFQIEKSNIAGNKPRYAITVLTSDENPSTDVTYRMTPNDISYTLTCVRHEYDTTHPELSALLDLFERNAPSVTIDQAKAKVSKRPNDIYVFEFSHSDREYSVTLWEGLQNPIFKIKGYTPNGTPTERSMTATEIGFAINKIAANLSLDDSVRYADKVRKMRDYQYDLNTPQIEPDKNRPYKSLELLI